MVRILLISLAVVLFASAELRAQQRTISGRVTSAEDGTSLPGVNVIVKGTTTGTATDVNGDYSISVGSDEAVLVFSFIGLETQEIAVGARSTIDVIMNLDVKQLSEVVVQGYSSVSEAQRIASTAQVKSDAIQNVPMPDVNQIIQGRAPGVFSTSPSGQPGAAQQILIRGVGSISAGNGPLYVLDGVILQNGDLTALTQTNDILSNLNPNDIESVTVLKDASGTALYGSRGSNGVIVITTKRGKAGSTQITARAQYGVTQPLIGHFDLMDGKQAWDFERQILLNSGASQAQVDIQRPESMLDNTNDWVDAAFRNGHTGNYEIQAQGGDEKTRFFVSGGLFKVDGTLIESSFERYSLRSNIDHNFNKKLDMSLNMNVSYTDQLNAVAGNRFASPLLGAFLTTPLQGARDPESGELFTGLETDYIGFTGDNFLYSAPLNPVINNNLRAIGKFALGYNILENLRASQTLNIDFVNVKEKSIFDPTTGDGFNTNGEVDEAFNNNTTLTSQTQLTGNWTIGEKHNLDALAVYEYQQAKESGFNAGGIGFASGKLTTLNSAASPQFVGGADTQYSFESYLAQVNYNFGGKYYFSGSFRRDGSSRFGANNRYANFWSVGASWRLIEENFLSNVGFLSDLKLRASYGITGNAAIDNFVSKGLYSFGAAYDGVPGSTPSTIDNPDLTWEIGKTANIGLDVGVFNDRLVLNVDVYQRNTEDLLQNVPISSTTGFSSAWRNTGRMQNQGIEAVANGQILTGGLKWNSTLNFSYNKNKVVELYNGQESAGSITLLREGEPINSFYLRRWAGVNPADGTPLWLTEDGGVTGNYSTAKQVVVGKAQPDYIIGFNNSWTFKGFSLSAFLYSALGHEIYNQSRAFIESDGAYFGTNYIADYVGNYWTTPGQEAKYPKPLNGGNKSSSSISTRYLEDASFLRLRNVVLGYSLPSRILTRTGLRNVKVYVQGQNLFTITNYSGFDPEALLSGNEFFRYPVGRSYSGGIELTF